MAVDPTADRIVKLPNASTTLIGTTTTQTLTNKTLTSPVINSGISGTAILDEDDMATNSATQLATQQSIKAYVDTKTTGPSSGFHRNGSTPATDNAIVRYDGTTGKLVQDSGATLSDSGLLESTYLKAGQFYLDTNGLFLIFRNGQLRFEGATENDFETSFKVVDPTADRQFYYLMKMAPYSQIRQILLI